MLAPLLPRRTGMTLDQAPHFLTVLAWAAKPHLCHCDHGDFHFSATQLAWRIRKHFQESRTYDLSQLIQEAVRLLPDHSRWQVVRPQRPFNSVTLKLLPPESVEWPSVSDALACEKSGLSEDILFLWTHFGVSQRFRSFLRRALLASLHPRNRQCLWPGQPQGHRPCRGHQ